MGRYFRFDGSTFDFAVRADVTERKDYWNEFVFSGERDQRIYGLTKITPSLTCEYDVNGLYFLKNVLGVSSNTASPYTITVGDVPEIGTIHAGVDGINSGITFAKIDTWDFTVEETGAAKVEFNALGKAMTTIAPTAYTADFSSAVIMPYNIGVTINTSSIGFVRLNLNVNNQLQAIFKTSTIPQTIRPTGLEVSGRMRILDYRDANVTDGSMRVVVGTIGTIDIPTVKIDEIPSRARGYDLPEVEYSFTGYPSATSQAIKVTMGSTLKW